MTQEVQVILTLEVSVTKTKKDIENILERRLEEWLVSIDNIKEEADIYETE